MFIKAEYFNRNEDSKYFGILLTKIKYLLLRYWRKCRMRRVGGQLITIVRSPGLSKFRRFTISVSWNLSFRTSPKRNWRIFTFEFASLNLPCDFLSIDSYAPSWFNLFNLFVQFIFFLSDLLGKVNFSFSIN